MTSAASHNHQKHAMLTRPSYGEWGRNELAILGTNCSSIRQLAQSIISHLPQYKIAFIDADHSSENEAAQSTSAAEPKAYIEYTNKLSFTRLDINTTFNAFQRRTLFNDCDLILVNGNHFTASKQIVVIDEKKSLQKKADQLTGIEMILMKDASLSIPGYLESKIPDLTSLPIASFTDTERILQHIKNRMLKNRSPVNGLVLSGGQSTRMGSDKGALVYHGKTQREHMYHFLKELCNDCFISCTAEQAEHIPHLPVIKDSFLGLGPMGGILSAFHHNPDVAWLTVACDLPFLQTPDLYKLMSSRNDTKLATAFWNEDGTFPEPLFTIWEPRAYPVLLQFLAQGYSCPRKVLINSGVEMLRATSTEALKNINTTEEYREALSTLQQRSSSFSSPQQVNG